MFPISFKGTIRLRALQSKDIDLVLNRVEQALQAARATRIVRTGNKVSFRGGIFRFVSNWNVLVPVGDGEIEVMPGSPGTVRYIFSCVETLAVTTILVGVLSIIAHSLVVFVVGWAWLFGMNYLIAAFRLPAFVRKAGANP